jgi:hypothetical protein
MSFSKFVIKLFLFLKTLTQAFRQYDHQQQGVITIRYEDFLTLIFGLKI